MAIHHDPDRFAKAIEDRLKAKARVAAKVLDPVAEGMYEDAIELTSGTESQPSLNKANNPFGRGPTTPRGKVRGRRRGLPINYQSGRLQRGLRMVRRNAQGRFDSGASWKLEVWGVPYAKYVIPKKPYPGSKMIYRAFWEEIDKGVKKRMVQARIEFRTRKAA